MKILNILLLLFIANMAFSQTRGTDCLCYEGTVLEDGDTELIETSPERIVYTVIPETPAVYETRTKKVLVKPTTTTSDPNCPACIIEVPAVYETVSFQVMVQPPQPPRITTTITPAQYKTVQTQRIKYDGRYVTKSTGSCN